ncbi:hypothetical protein C8R44DRAFT_872397 [Mycena epipterygia]|nr:hypothetical protein C8R44DRAFT_872397 [Mycena epipterygia]
MTSFHTFTCRARSRSRPPEKNSLFPDCIDARINSCGWKAVNVDRPQRRFDRLAELCADSGLRDSRSLMFLHLNAVIAMEEIRLYREEPGRVWVEFDLLDGVDDGGSYFDLDEARHDLGRRDLAAAGFQHRALEGFCSVHVGAKFSPSMTLEVTSPSM